MGLANEYVNSKVERYHDEWFATENGGGQELVATKQEQATRLYAGGVILASELEKIGITGKDVISCLITSVRALQGKTRLHEPVSYTPGEGWEYKYEILKQPKEVMLTIGYESIVYHGREVFAHGFLLSPIV
jgi:hypothetical protein